MVEASRIEDARRRIRDYVYLSPCARSEAFSKLTGLAVHLKLENLQMTGSFKERGALSRLLALSDAERPFGVIAASAGNHAQGVAYHASRLGIRCVVVMPVMTALVKVTNTRRYGAEVVLYGDGYDSASAEAHRLAERDGLTLVHPFDDEAVIAGQGTVGLELLEQTPDVDAVVVPIGGGGLAAGIALAVKAKRPSVRVVGVQTERVPSAVAAREAKGPVLVPGAPTIADGIAVRRSGTKTFPLIQKYVDDIVTVTEDEIANAVLLLLETEKTVAEGAGAVGVAALVNGKAGLKSGARTAVVVSGGNIDVNLLSRIIERGLAKDGRLLRLEVKISDVPGALHPLVGLIAAARANILQIAHDRAFTGAALGESLVDMTVETRGQDHVEEILAALGSAGYDARRVRV